MVAKNSGADLDDRCIESIKVCNGVEEVKNLSDRLLTVNVISKFST